MFLFSLLSLTISPLSTSTLLPSIPTTSMVPLTIPHAFVDFMQNVPNKLAGVIVDPKVQTLMAQLAVTFPLPPPPTKPQKMEVTMQIFEVMERLSAKQPKEDVKDIAEELEDSNWDEYFKHLEGELRMNIDKVALDEEAQQTLEDEVIDKLDEYYEVETSDQELDEEQPQEQKYKEANLKEHRSEEGKMDIETDVEITDEPP